MNDCRRPDEKQARPSCLRLQLQRIVTQRFAARRPPPSYEQCPGRHVDDVRPSHVADSKQQTVDAIPTTNDRPFAEDDRLVAGRRARQLGVRDAGQHGRQEHTETRLDQQSDRSPRTRDGDRPGPVADRVLSLDGKQKGRVEAVDCVDARRWIGFNDRCRVIAVLTRCRDGRGRQQRRWQGLTDGD